MVKVKTYDPSKVSMIVAGQKVTGIYIEPKQIPAKSFRVWFGPYEYLMFYPAWFGELK